MSRHTILNEDGTCYIVGWDNALQTYFGQLEDGDDMEDLAGITPDEIQTVEELESQMGIEIPLHIARDLTREKLLTPGRSPLQELINEMYRRAIDGTIEGDGT